MQTFHDKESARQWVWAQRMAGQTVGVVPTMGALHDGHVALAERSVVACDRTIATIFVNPTQFAPHEDLDRYPRTLQQDLERLNAAGVDAVFVPAVDEMYLPGFASYVLPPAIAEPWEGAQRPDHYRGVTTVVAKLFHILPASHAFFGHKDYQQARVIQQMVAELDFAIEIEICPTVREPDGLALSSRNRYLTDEQREQSLGLYRALQAAQAVVAEGEDRIAEIESAMRNVLKNHQIDRVDYAIVVDSHDLQPAKRLAEFSEGPIALIAAHVGTTRLIDNLKLLVK